MPAASGDWPGADMAALFFLIIIVCIALGLIGVVVKGLLFLLFIGIVVFLLNFVILGARLRGKRRKPAR